MLPKKIMSKILLRRLIPLKQILCDRGQKIDKDTNIYKFVLQKNTEIHKIMLRKR